MSNGLHWQSGTALLLALGLGAGAITPIVAAAPVIAQTHTQTQFSDVPSGHWAREFITTLADRGIIAGFPDGTFRPNEPVTRAQYAAMVRSAFVTHPCEAPQPLWMYLLTTGQLQPFVKPT
jgi:hypothetical protein